MANATNILNENFYNKIDQKIDRLDDLHLDKLLGYCLFAENARKFSKTDPSITHRIYNIIYKCLSNGYNLLHTATSVDVIIATCIKTHNIDLLKQKYLNPCHVIQFDSVFALLQVISEYELKYGPKFCELVMASSNKDNGTIFFQKAITWINIEVNRYLQKLNLINKFGLLTKPGKQIFPISIYEHNITPKTFNKYTGFNLLNNINKVTKGTNSMYSHIALRYVAIYLFIKIQNIRERNRPLIKRDVNILNKKNQQQIKIPNYYYDFLNNIKQVNAKMDRLCKSLN